MNKVQHINLGSVPFTIDEDAFEHLSLYLETIHRHFRDSEGYEEITTDIEARMAELIQEGLGDRTIVSLRDVKDAIVIMGTPEDFGAEPIEEGEAPKTERKSNSGYRPGKRLFRNPDDEVIGGVCSGIAAYFGIQDPLWIRLLFILIAISGGFGIPAYIILWAIIPKAETASDRLAMRGEPINASNIGRIIQEEFEHISSKVQELGSELGGKKKGFQGQNELGEALRKGVSLLGGAIRALIDLAASFWKPLLIIVGAVFIFAFALAWIGIVGGAIFAWPFFEYFSPARPFLSFLAAFNILIIIGMVLLSLVLFITRLLYGARLSAPWRTALIVFWSLNVVSFFAVGSIFARQFSHEGKSLKETTLSGLPTDTLRLEMARGYEGDSWMRIDDELILRDEELLIRNVRVNLVRAEGNAFTMATRISARGETSRDAEKLASMVSFNPSLEGETLLIPREFSIPKGSKWRGQEVRLTIGVPAGKALRISGEVGDFVDEMDKADPSQYLWRNPDKLWIMTSDGFNCQGCDVESEDAEELGFSDFRKLNIEGELKVVIGKGDDYSLRLSGVEALTRQVDVEQIGDVVNVSTSLSRPSSPVRLFITMPELAQLDAEGTDDVRIEGFEGGNLQLSFESSHELKANIHVDTLLLNQAGSGGADLRGQARYLRAVLSDNARLDAEKMAIGEAYVSAADNSRAKLGSVPLVQQQAAGNARVDVAID